MCRFIVRGKKFSVIQLLDRVKKIEVNLLTDIATVIGVGVKIPMVVPDLSLDACYNYGLTSTDKINSGNIYNRVIAVYLGLAFYSLSKS
jgi:hypothetical protein